MGAHPYLVCQLHWHAADYRPLLQKMGIDWEKAWAEFEEACGRLERGEQKYLGWEDVDV
jgi:heterodisulfide reductase subunit B